MQLHRLICPVLMSLLLLSCNNRPKDVLSDDKMVDLLADMQLAEAMQQNLGTLPDSIRQDMGARILAYHGVTKAEFDSTMLWYAKNMDRYRDLYKSVNKRLESKGRKLGSSDILTPSDESNLWPYSPFVQFLPQSDTESLSFSIPVSGIEKGSRFEWKLRINNQAEMEQLLGVDYKDGSSEFVRHNTYGNRNVKITLYADTAKEVKRLYGVATPRKMSIPVWADSISIRTQGYDSVAYRSKPYQEHLRPKYHQKSQTLKTHTNDSTLKSDGKEPRATATDAKAKPSKAKDLHPVISSVKDKQSVAPKPKDKHSVSRKTLTGRPSIQTKSRQEKKVKLMKTASIERMRENSRN